MRPLLRLLAVEHSPANTAGAADNQKGYGTDQCAPSRLESFHGAFERINHQEFLSRTSATMAGTSACVGMARVS